jgi:hypothetical protein
MIKIDNFKKNINFWDWKRYGNENKDLYNKASSLLKHVIRHGINEGRKVYFNKELNFPERVIRDNLNLLLPKDFNWEIYIGINPELKNLCERDAKIHYILHGNYENKIYKIEKNDINKIINSLEKIIIIKPIFGLGNRLRAIASAYSICKKKNMKLVINWIPDEHCNCTIFDLIPNASEFSIVTSEEIKVCSNKFITYNYNEVENGKKFEYIDDSNDKIYIISNCTLNNKYSYCHFNEFFSSLSINQHTNNLINKIPDIENYIGMHIRMEGGKKYQSINAEKGDNWTIQEKELMYKYREKSHIDNFIHQINNILHQNPEQKIFISTDMKSNYEKLINMYGSETIKFLDRNLFDRSKEQLCYALADIILLSRCKQFFGSTWSSFSELVLYFQKKNVRIDNIFSINFKEPNLSINKNFFNKELKEGNSIVCVSMNRTENILQSLPYWLKVRFCHEIVILDFGSTEPLSEVLKQHNITNEKLKIYRVDNVTQWHLSKAYNLAIKLASHKNIYKLDSDDCCNKFLILNHPLNDKNIYYHGKWQDAKNKNELQIAGKMFFPYELFIKANGYNENITTYGWDDCEFNERLQKLSVEKSVNIENFNFIEHSDDMRQKQNEIGLLPKHYIHINRLLCKQNILNWNEKSLHSDFIYDKKGVFHVSNKYHIENKFINKDVLNNIILVVKEKY